MLILFEIVLPRMGRLDVPERLPDGFPAIDT
jgi:hypothetical protein